MTTDLIRIYEASDLEPLIGEWNDLLLACGGTVFDTPEWILANIESFPPLRAEVLVARSEGNVVGVVPMAIRKGRRDLTYRSWGELASLPHADYGSLLVRENSASTVAGAILDRFSRESDVSALHLGHLPNDRSFGRAFPLVARQQGFKPQTREAYVVRRMALDDKADLPSLMDRPSLNKRERQLTRLGDVRFRAVTDWHAILDDLEVFFALHVRRFREKGMTSPLESPGMQRFYAALVRRLGPQRAVILSSLDLDGTPAAMRFSLCFGGTIHLYAATFDPALSRYSPGILQLRRLVEYAPEVGVTTLDLGIGDSQHKQLFEEASSTQLVNLAVFRTALGFAEARSVGWLRTLSAEHPSVGGRVSRLRRLLPARQPI